MHGSICKKSSGCWSLCRVFHEAVFYKNFDAWAALTSFPDRLTCPDALPDETLFKIEVIQLVLGQEGVIVPTKKLESDHSEGENVNFTAIGRVIARVDLGSHV